MEGEAAERYHSRRIRQLEEQRARRQEWDFLAAKLSDEEVTDCVPVGWRRLVLRLHHDLLRLDPSYRLLELGEDMGGLLIDANYTLPTGWNFTRRIHQARAEALATCEVCSADGRLRVERGHMKTLCDDCWIADRAAAAERGERYAEVVLDYLTSGDDAYPTPEETMAWLDSLDAGTDADEV